MTWAHKRQFLYVSIVFGFFLVMGFLISYPYLHVAPTCFDLKKNGKETGVDCGGPSCSRSCNTDVEPVSVLWSRVFQVVPGRYNAIAYLENKNANTAINKIKYQFRFTDKNNVMIGTRDGETYVPTSGRFAVFESAIGFGDSIPVYTTFSFTEDPVWVKVPQAEIDQLKLFISGINLQDEKTSPRMSAHIQNNSLFIIPDINVVAVLYDKVGNAISASRTYVNALNGEESTDVNFTWPEPFTQPIVAKEVIPMYNIFDVNFK